MSASKGFDWYNETEIDKMHMLAACYEGNIEQVKEFLEKGVHVEEFDDDRVTALQTAASRGHTKLTEYLLSMDADLERCNVVGYTALLHACREGHIEVVKLLIQRGARLDTETFTGASPLTLACAGGHFELVKYLITFKDVVDINPKSRDVAPSPLMAAAFKNQPVIASCLVSRGARTDYVMPQYALDIISCVVMCSSSTMFSALLDLGARIEGIRNYKNSNIDDLVNICQRHDIYRLLIDHKRQHKRVVQKSVDIRQVISEGRVVELRDLLGHPEKCTKLENGETPLMYAVIFGHIETLKEIIGSKADLNTQESKLGLTALMIAAILGDNEMIKELIKSEAKVSIKCEFGWTAIEFAYSANGIDAKTIALMHKALVSPTIHKFSDSSNSLSLSTSRLNRSGSNTITRLFQPLQKALFSSIEKPPEFSARDEFLSGFEVAHINFAHFPECFVMANDILGGKKRKTFEKPSLDDYMQMIRNIAMTWHKNGFLLKPFPLGIAFNGDFSRIIESMVDWSPDEEPEFDGNYGKAQKNCAIMIGQAPSTKTSSNSLSSFYSESGHLRRSEAYRRPVALSSSASGGVISGHRVNPPPSPSAHSLGELSEKRNSRSSFLASHLRSMSSQSAQPPRYRYLNESTSSSPRISPKRVQKISNPDDFIQQKLKAINLQQYSQAFRDQEVDIQTFLRCNENDIREIVSSVSSNEAHIVAIVNLIAELRQHCSVEK